MEDNLVLLIRANASNKIGVGHVMRCLALAQAWKKTGGKVVYVSDSLETSFLGRLEKEGISHRKVETETGSIDDANKLLQIAEELQCRAITIDGYDFQQEFFDTLIAPSTKELKFKTLLIDDYGQLQRFCSDFVLNQNYGANPELYQQKADHTQLLLGTDYSLIRDEFLGTNEPVEFKDKGASKILVTLGGSDPRNHTGFVVNGLKTLTDPSLEFRVIVGGLYQNYEELLEQVNGDDRFSVFRSVEDMSSFYEWAEFAICAGGSSNWEMCCYGIPRMVWVIAANQQDIADQLDLAGIVKKVEADIDSDPSLVAELVERLRNDVSWLTRSQRLGKELVDGRGAHRCVELLQTS